MEESAQRGWLNPPARLAAIAFVILAPTLVLEACQVADARPIGFFISIVCLWVSEIIPLTASAFAVPIGATLLGFFTPSEAFASFGNPIIFLLIGVFLIVRALQRHGVASRFAEILVTLPFIRGSVERLAIVVTLASWAAGMWMSNTATCALLIPVALGIAEALSQVTSEKDARTLRTRFLLISAFTPSIAGMATPIGSLPNLIAVQALERAGHSVNFVEWMARALPLSAVLLAASYLILRFRYPLSAIDARPAQALFKDSLRRRGKLSFQEGAALVMFLCAVILWLGPPVLVRLFPENPVLATLAARLHPSVVAVLAALPLFVLAGGPSRTTPLQASDLRAIDWSSIILFGGGLTLGEVLSVTGLADRLGGMLAAAPVETLYGTLLLTTAVAVFLSEFSSNTAAAALLVPIVSSQAALLAADTAVSLIMTTVFACGFGFLLPVSTPPNAMVFGTRALSLRDMLTSGAWLDACGLFLLPLYGAWLLR